MDRNFGRLKLLGEMPRLGMRFVVRFKSDVSVDSGDERVVRLKRLAYAMALVHWKEVYDHKEGRQKLVRYSWCKIKRPEVEGELHMVIGWLEGGIARGYL